MASAKEVIVKGHINRICKLMDKIDRSSRKLVSKESGKTSLYNVKKP